MLVGDTQLEITSELSEILGQEDSLYYQYGRLGSLPSAQL